MIGLSAGAFETCLPNNQSVLSFHIWQLLTKLLASDVYRCIHGTYTLYNFFSAYKIFVQFSVSHQTRYTICKFCCLCFYFLCFFIILQVLPSYDFKLIDCNDIIRTWTFQFSWHSIFAKFARSFGTLPLIISIERPLAFIVNHKEIRYRDKGFIFSLFCP